MPRKLNIKDEEEPLFVRDWGNVTISLITKLVYSFK